jgi:protein-disulfide isomerase
MKRTLLWGGAALVVVLIGWGMVKLSNSVPTPAGNGTLTVAVSDRDNMLGPASASVTLVEYSDFQCPACAEFYSVVKQALAEPQLKDKVRFVYRYFPLTNIHANADLSARAAQAAALQGKFWEMHDKLFEGQKAWADLSDAAARGVFKSYAGELKLDVDRFMSDIDGAPVRDRVREQSAGAEQAGVNSTPTFFVNGTQMPQPKSYDEFKQYLIDASKPTPTPSENP